MSGAGLKKFHVGRRDFEVELQFCQARMKVVERNERGDGDSESGRRGDE